MNGHPRPDPVVLGRILLAQDSFQAASDEQHLAQGLARGLAGLPGAAGCLVCLDGVHARTVAAGPASENRGDERPPDLAVRVPTISLHQVVTNLLTNALEASRPETVVEVSSRITENNVEICIRDRGMGIAPNEMEQIYQPFFTSKTGDSLGKEWG